MIPSMISISSTFSCWLHCRAFRGTLVYLILFYSASVSVLVQAQQNETATNTVPTLAPTPFVEPEKGCYTDLNQVAARLQAKNAFEVETYTLCPNTVYKIGFLGANGLTEDGFPALTLRQNTRYICGADGKSSNNCVITGGQFQIISTYSSFNKEVKSNIVVKGVTFQNGQTAGALLVAPGEVQFEDCIFRVRNFCCSSLDLESGNGGYQFSYIYRFDSAFFVQEQSNVGAASLIFFLDTTRRLLREMNDLGLETEQERVKHEVDFYAHLLNDPVAMQEWRQDVVARRGKERNLEEMARELEIKVTRQNVTFVDCKFEGNTYGEKTDATNYGTIGVETDDNDLAVHGCIFEDNKFGDINIVVSTV